MTFKGPFPPELFYDFMISGQALLNASVDGLAFKMAKPVLNANSHFAEHN